MATMIQSKRHPKKKESISEKLPQNEGMISPTETAERLAKEHGMSRATVERSADLFKSLKMREMVPEIE